jgi:hypothetical protein
LLLATCDFGLFYIASLNFIFLNSNEEVGLHDSYGHSESHALKLVYNYPLIAKAKVAKSDGFSLKDKINGSARVKVHFL